MAKATPTKLKLAEFLPEIDFDDAPGGKSIYHDIQTTIEKSANSLIQEMIKTDPRFAVATKPATKTSSSPSM